MIAFPHRYAVAASSRPTGAIEVTSPGLPALATEAPAEFGGPGDRWSPETLLVAACVDCFLLTFRSVAQASKLEWESLDCDGEGVLDRVDGKTRFTGLTLRARLKVAPGGGDPSRAQRILEKAERACLVTSSLAFEPTLEAVVEGA
jgi:organic hydroperoxide reductase OsmC/OhrA